MLDLKRIVVALTLVAGFALSTPSLRADVDRTFSFSGLSTDGSRESGSLIVDSTNGTVSSLDLALGSPDSFTFTEINNQFSNGSYYEVQLRSSSDNSGTLDISTSNLSTFTGGGYDGDFSASGSPDVDLLIGNLTLVPTATPEPASLSLLGVAGVGLLKRRRRA